MALSIDFISHEGLSPVVAYFFSFPYAAVGSISASDSSCALASDIYGARIGARTISAVAPTERPNSLSLWYRLIALTNSALIHRAVLFFLGLLFIFPAIYLIASLIYFANFGNTFLFWIVNLIEGRYASTGVTPLCCNGRVLLGMQINGLY